MDIGSQGQAARRIKRRRRSQSSEAGMCGSAAGTDHGRIDNLETGGVAIPSAPETQPGGQARARQQQLQTKRRLKQFKTLGAGRERGGMGG